MTTGLESTVTLRPAGPWRYLDAAFLAVWLAGWAIGEVFAVGVIAAVLLSAIPALDRIVFSTPLETLTTGVSIFVFLFLLVWTTFWTIGGIAAITKFLRDVAGEDRLQLVPAGIELTRRAGPFKRVRTIDRGHIRRIRVRRHDQAVVADTPSGAEFLTELGTVDDRYATCRWLLEGLRLPDDAAAPDLATPPPGWDGELAEDGSTRLTRRARRARPIQAVILWFVTALVALGWIRGTPMDRFTGATVVAQVVTLLLASASAWLTWERSSWLARPGRLIFRRQIGPWISERHFEHAQFAVESSKDSDGDTSYQLIVRTANDRRTIQSAVNDDGEIVDCARWLAKRTGFSLSPVRS